MDDSYETKVALLNEGKLLKNFLQNGIDKTDSYKQYSEFIFEHSKQEALLKEEGNLYQRP